MQDEDTNWVAAHARCNLSSIFEALIERVRQDVKEINKLPSERRQRHKFESHMDNGSISIRTFIVDWYKEDNSNNRSKGNVLFTENCTSITFQQTNGKPTSVVPQWNESETKCDLNIDGKKCEMWEISQMALGYFFFGTIGE